MNRFEKALIWIDRKKREHFGEIALLKGFAFDGQKYKTPEEMQTIEYALKLAARLEQEPSEDMCLAGSGFSRPPHPLDSEAKKWYDAGLCVAHNCYVAMIEQLKKEVKDA